MQRKLNRLFEAQPRRENWLRSRAFNQNEAKASGLTGHRQTGETGETTNVQERAGSYSVSGHFGAVGYDESFITEGDVQSPSETPVIADGVVPFLPRPMATEYPPVTLDVGANGGMGAFTIPRHGSRPRNLSAPFPPDQRLPGAINVGFFDGHVERVQLERLWYLQWHKGYVPPAKRPGLK